MTPSDPIADMLTRVRNALTARHQKVDVPASKMKMELARILKDEGYILNYKMAEEGTLKMIRHLSQVHSAESACDLEDPTCFPSRLPRVCGLERDPARARGPWRKHLDNSPRSDDRP